MLAAELPHEDDFGRSFSGDAGLRLDLVVAVAGRLLLATAIFAAELPHDEVFGLSLSTDAGLGVDCAGGEVVALSLSRCAANTAALAPLVLCPGFHCSGALLFQPKLAA